MTALHGAWRTGRLSDRNTVPRGYMFVSSYMDDLRKRQNCLNCCTLISHETQIKHDEIANILTWKRKYVYCRSWRQ